MFIWSLIVLTDSENSNHFVSIESVTTLLMDKIHSTPPIKFHIDPSKHIPGINQHLMSKETHQGIKPIIEDYRAQCTMFFILASKAFPFYW